MRTPSWVDIALILIVLWSVATGLRAGLARVLVGFFGAIAGLLVGFWFYRLVAAKLEPWISDPTIAKFLGFFILFVGVMILAGLVGAILSRMFAWVGLSWFNRLMGGAAGFVRGVLLIAAVVDVLVAFTPSPTPDMLRNSLVVPYISEVSGWLINLAPAGLREAFDEQMENLRQFWKKRPEPSETRSAQVRSEAPVRK